MPFPLLLLLLVGGVAAVAAANSSSPEKGTSSGSPGLPNKEPTGDPKKDTEAILDNANSFWSAIGSSASMPSSPDFSSLAATAQAKQKKAEDDSKAYINKTIDRYQNYAVVAAAKTGVGAAAIPVIIFGAQAGKWAAEQQTKFIKWMLGAGADGWNETWRNNLNGELEWLTKRGIPFPQWNQSWHKSPMGYINGGGGTKCGFGGLCEIRADFEGLSAEDASSAMSGFDAMKRHMDQNPLVQAMWAQSVSPAMPTSWTLLTFTSKGLREGELIKINPYKPFTDEPEAYPRFFYYMVSGLATSLAQDYDLPFVYWKQVVEAAWAGWDTAIYKIRSNSDTARAADPAGAKAFVGAYNAAVAKIKELKGK